MTNSIILILKAIAKKSLMLAFALLITITIIFILVVLYNTRMRDIEDDFNAGFNSLYAMQIVDQTPIEGINQYLYEHDGNRTNIQFACADSVAYNRLLPLFGSDYVNESCEVVGVVPR